MKNCGNSRRKPQWLVSVRDEDEAKMAFQFAIDILDFKDPSAGPLAPVASKIWHTAARDLRRHPQEFRQPVLSAALGESDQGAQIASEVPPDFRYAKVGPSRCDCEQDVLDLWELTRNKLPRSVELVAVAYADHDKAKCLGAVQMVRLAHQAGLKRILIDTFDKSAGSSVKILSPPGITSFARLARQFGLWWALAGSVTLEEATEMTHNASNPQVEDSNITPDCIAIRGAVCEGSRIGRLSPEKMLQWEQRLSFDAPEADAPESTAATADG